MDSPLVYEKLPLVEGVGWSFFLLRRSMAGVNVACVCRCCAENDWC